MFAGRTSCLAAVVCLCSVSGHATAFESAVIREECRNPASPVLGLRSLKTYWSDVKGLHAKRSSLESELAPEWVHRYVTDRLKFNWQYSNKETLEVKDQNDPVLTTAGGPSYGLVYELPFSAFFEGGRDATRARIRDVDEELALNKAQVDFFQLAYDFKIALVAATTERPYDAERVALKLAALSPTFAGTCLTDPI